MPLETRYQFQLWRTIDDIIAELMDSIIANGDELLLWNSIPNLDSIIADYIYRSVKDVDTNDFIDNHLRKILIHSAYTYFSDVLSEHKAFLAGIIAISKDVVVYKFHGDIGDIGSSNDSEAFISDLYERKTLNWSDLSSTVLKIMIEGWLRVKVRYVDDISNLSVRQNTPSFMKWVRDDFLPRAMESWVSG